jgi:amino acid adenylation domain-containing protein/non-ribosomal peptide synthase protein (TIGR01720 family)
MIEDVLVLSFGEAETFTLLAAHAHELAAVLIELPQSRRLDLHPQAFLQQLRQLTQEKGIALILDEVITGFRVHPGGVQALFHIQADLVTYGKTVGGGLPVGLIAGKAEYMDAIDGGPWNYGDQSYPQAVQTFFAGTYFKHPYLMPAVLATMQQIKHSGPELQQRLDQRTELLVQRLNEYFEQEQVPIFTTRFSSLFRFVFPPALQAVEAHLFFYHLLDQGIYVSETRSCFLSTAHSEEDIQLVVRAVKAAVTAMRAGGFLSKPPAKTPARSVRTLPLTEAQKELWFMAQLGNDSSRAYNEAITLHFQGPFQVQAMQRSWQELIQRHEALRTTFSAEGDCQRIASELTLTLAWQDFSTTPESAQQAHIARWQAEEMRRPFDLEHGPLLRVSLLKLAEQRHLLVIIYQHIILDGWSVGTLLRELSVLYTAYCQSKAHHLPEPTPYSAYVHWQAEQEQSAAERYWLRQFADPVPALNLPTDHPRPLIKTYAGARQRIVLESSLARALKNLGVAHNCTLFTTLLAGFQLLLHRLTAQNDLVIAIAAAGQPAMGSTHLVGYCVNFLPLRSRLSGSLSFLSYLAQVRQTVLDAHSHQQYPFHTLVKRLKLARDPGQLPLTNLMFNLDTAATPELFELTASMQTNPTGYSRFDLSFNVVQSGHELLVECDYNTDLFEASTMQNWLAYLQTLLKSITIQPAQNVLTLPLLSEAERHRLLIEWNATQQAYPSERCLHHLIEEQVAQTPERIALVCEDTHLTYQALDTAANQLAHYLRRLGVRAEMRVGIFLQRRASLLIGLLGILKAGGVYVPLDPLYPQERLAFMLADAQVAVLLCADALRAAIPEQNARVAYLDSDWPDIASERTGPVLAPVHPDQLAYITYTSGSTGMPKGVQIAHRAVVNILAAFAQRPGLQAQDMLLAITTLSFDIAALELFLPLTTGACLTLLSRETALDGTRLAEQLASSGATVMQATPSGWRLLLEAGWQGSPGLRMLCGGETLSAELANRLRAKGACLWNLYGPSETTIWSTLQPVLTEQGGVPIGRPLANTQIYLLDPQLQPVPPGIPGEVYIGGPGVARGYLKRPGETAERFIPHPFAQSPLRAGTRIYKTGDMARYLPDGTIEYLGRSDSQVKLRGHRIELEEIETLLVQHPAVRQALAHVYEDRAGNRRLVAYLILQTHAVLPTGDVRLYLKERLPEYMLPAHFVSMQAFPLSENGKINRRLLPPPENTPSRQKEAFVPASTPNEKILADIWTQVLGNQQTGRHDNFFELGGDSLLCARVVVKANRAGIPLTPQQMFQYQTIAELATIIANAPAQPEAGLVPLTPIQHWFFEQHLPEPQHWNQALLLETRQPLDPVALAKAGQALLQHHDALRLRAREGTHGWQLFNTAANEPLACSLFDLSTRDEPHQAAALQESVQRLQASLNIARGPLLRLAYFKMGPHRAGRLLIIIHHLAVDIISWRILLDDLQCAYQQSCRQEEIRLPARTASFKQWAVGLQQYAQTAAVRQELAYWLTMLKEPVAPLPLDYDEGRSANTEASARSIFLALTATETQILLQELPRTRRVQISEVLLTALALAITAWTGDNTLLVDIEGHGREMILAEVDLSHTVGWFTSFVPLLCKLDTGTDPDGALKAIKERFRGMPNGGIGYGLLRYLCEDQAIARQLRHTPQAEILFHLQRQAAQALPADALFAPAREAAGPIRSPRGKRSHVLEVEGIVAGDRLHLHWTYSAQMHRRTTIERLAASFMAALRSLIVGNQALPAKIYPLSPMQQGLLFHSLYTPQAGVYIEQLSCTLQGRLQILAFQQVWQRVLNHYQSLRTAFLWENCHHPLQVVCQNVEVPWQSIDWQQLSAGEQQAQRSIYLREERARGFDLTRAPLMRLTLIQLAPERYDFHWSFHHLLLDGWSISLVLNDVFTLYEACVQKRTCLPAHHPSYSEYIDWVQQQDISQAQAFWRRKLTGFTAPTSLRVASSKRAAGAPGSQEQRIWLSEKLTSDLQSLGRLHHLTLNTLMQGAWALLLSQYSGTNDVVFGSVVSGRPVGLAHADSMVGLCMNTLPVRVLIQPQTPLLPWLQALQLELIEARRYEYSPLSQIQKCSDVPGGQPLFESLLAFENYPFASSLDETHGSIEVQDLQILEQVSYPLTITVVPARRLSLRLSYDSQRFDSATITRMAGQYQALLEAIGANPEQPLARYSLLTKAEEQQILLDWNKTQTSYPQATCIHQLFEAQASRTPDALAITAQRTQLTYQEVNLRANQVAHYLRKQTLESEEPVGLCIEDVEQLVIGMLAILKAGGAYVPLDPQYPAERLSFMLQDTRARLILTQESLRPRLPVQAAHILCLDTAWTTLARERTTTPHNRSHAYNLAYIIYTSGSTGRPKGVAIPHRAVNRLVCNTNYVQIHPSDRIAQVSNTSFDAVTFEIWGALLQGAQLVGSSREIIFSPQNVASYLHEQAITIMFVTTALFNQLVSDLPTVFQSLRYLLSGGEAVDPRWVRAALTHGQPGQFLYVYGPTENTTFSSWYPVQEVAETATTLPIGRPIANTQLYLLDAQLQPVPVMLPGELYIGGDGLTRGYLHCPDITADRLVPHPFSTTPGARLYKTGDMARYLPGGAIEFLGRRDHQVKLHGFRIELEEIATLLQQHPALQDAVVLLRSDNPGEKRLVGYVVFQAGRQETGSDLREYLRAKLPVYMLPSTFVVLKILPLTPNGKVDRQALPAPGSSRPGLKEAYVPPRTPTEATLAAIWLRVLGLSRVGVCDNFFELGGDSILCFQIIAQAHQSGLHLTPKHIFDHPTIARLAEVASPLEGVALEQGPITGHVPLTPIQRWFFEQQLPEPQHWNQSFLLRATQTPDAALLQQALAALSGHHDVLRSRFVAKEGRWEQLITDDEGPLSFPVIDLSGLDTPARQAATARTAARFQQSLNLSEGPVWQAALFKSAPDQADHLLLIAHHLIIDGLSWRILLEDLHTAYQQLQSQQALKLPPKTVSSQHWSHTLEQYAQSQLLGQEVEYWCNRARGSVLPLPLDFPDGRNTEADARTISVSLSQPETQALLQAIPRIYHTRIDEVLLTALLYTWQQWTGTSQLLLDMESHGREAPDPEIDLSRSIGWFTALFPLCLTAEKTACEQGPGEILPAVKEQVRAIPQRGIGYGVLRYLSLDEHIVARLRELPSPQISFNYLGQFEQEAHTPTLFTIASENYGPERSEHGRRSHILEINGLIADRQLHMHWTYSAQLHRQATIERLAHGFSAALHLLIEQAQSIDTAVYTPSDFPDTALSQEELDLFLAGLDTSGE